MKRWSLVLCLASAVCLGLPSVAAGAKTDTPTSILEESCYLTGDGDQVYGVMFGVTGFPPNTDFTGTLSTPTSQFGPATVTTNENGDWWYWLGGFVPGTWTWTVESPYLGGTVTKEITVTCPKPTTLEACRGRPLLLPRLP